MKQAKAAVGNVYADGNYNDGVFHTLTVWEDRSSMRKYMVSGAHAKAMKILGDIAYGTKVYGYETNEIPSSEEAYVLWHEHGNEHGQRKAKPSHEQQQQQREYVF